MPTIQDVLRKIKTYNFSNTYTQSVLNKLNECRTASLGYHYYQCDNNECNHKHYQYHSCRNRHCPQCNWQKQEQWQEERLNELLPVKYFHVVFTLPHEINAIVLYNREIIFTQLFNSAAYCLLTLSKDPKWLGATPSITAVLHTWGQKLNFHPHLHCIVSGGGVDKNLNWLDLKKKCKQDFLFPYNVMESLFKKHFLRNINKLIENGKLKINDYAYWKSLKQYLFNKKWIVYAKQPVTGTLQVVEYLARYTHKIAITNNRIIEVNQDNVTFKYKDYNDSNKTKLMTLPVNEFIKRFEQHILPKRFVKTRHYGILGNFKRKARINAILAKMQLPIHPPLVQVPFQLRLLEKYGTNITICNKCKKGNFILVDIVYPRNRGSPQILIKNNSFAKF